MTRFFHHWRRVPLAARILMLAAIVTAGLTVAAAAREPEAVPVQAQPEDTATGAATGTSTSTEAPTSSVARGGGEPIVEAHVHDEESTEGAIPVPSVEPAPPEHESRFQDGGRFSMPLNAWTAVTDRYGAPRGPGYIHGGIDLALDDYPSSPVYSACTGTVSTADFSSTYGYHVVVNCGEGWTTLYAHFSEILAAPGQAVTGETILGVSGSTGYSTGEHLHFEIMWQGARVNPENYLDFHIPPGTPLSNSPLYIPGRSASGSSGTTGVTPGTTTGTAEPTPEPEATATPTKVPPTATPTATSTPTATPTFTPTPTPMPPTPTRTPTPRPVIR
ncbi:MAG: M23 family metallopeptidase [Dehalococcoidia bacterium]|nr:M23 family metallopeptidase [Dehalococcoidia bacterium]